MRGARAKRISTNYPAYQYSGRRHMLKSHPTIAPQLFTVLGALCFMASQWAAAQGGPPMLTDDPDTPGAGNWEINTAYTEQRTNEEHLRSFPHVDFNYGLGEHIQLKFETGWVFADAPDGVKSGVDDSLLGVKWRFLAQELAGLNISVHPQLR